ncbi:MAG: hypothetical protein M3Q99_10245 [Acidobacteriota bacterium]|nr:hypothetical protein [Acidobacteriota bacterium]
MENKGLNYSQDLQIQELLGRFLRVNSSINGLEASGKSHLDEDSLAAFVEGNLQRRESQPVINHLVNCSFCRHITAELIKLDYAFAEVEQINPVSINGNNEPSKISEVLSGLLSGIFGGNDGAVFAHHESEKEPENPEKTENTKEEK